MDKRSNMSCTTKFVIVGFVLILLLIIGIGVTLGSGESVYDYARRVPSNFYRRVQDLMLGDGNYRQPTNSADCVPYAVAYMLNISPKSVMELWGEFGGSTTDFRTALHGRYGIRLDIFNVLLGPDRKWRDQPYDSWRLETEGHMRAHLPVIVFPEVPGGGYHAIAITHMARTTAIFFDPEHGAFYTVPLDDLFRAMLGDKFDDGGYVFNRRKIK